VALKSSKTTTTHSTTDYSSIGKWGLIALAIFLIYRFLPVLVKKLSSAVSGGSGSSLTSPVASTMPYYYPYQSNGNSKGSGSLSFGNPGGYGNQGSYSNPYADYMSTPLSQADAFQANDPIYLAVHGLDFTNGESFKDEASDMYNNSGAALWGESNAVLNTRVDSVPYDEGSSLLSSLSKPFGSDYSTPSDSTSTGNWWTNAWDQAIGASNSDANGGMLSDLGQSISSGVDDSSTVNDYGGDDYVPDTSNDSQESDSSAGTDVNDYSGGDDTGGGGGGNDDPEDRGTEEEMDQSDE
jgi:hypothetical protein